MVITQSDIASQIGFEVIKNGGNAIDAAVATGFAMAVTHPTAGNIGGGGFIVYRPATGEPAAYDFREVGPSRSSPEMWLKDGKYDFETHHNSHLAVGVPGTVAGLHLAWKEAGSKPWKELVAPSIRLARDGFELSHGLARSLANVLDNFEKYPASLAQFSKNGKPYEAGEIFKQPDLARTLTRIADQGPAGFYEGETAALIEKEMKANGGLITMADLKAYQAKKRAVVKGTYRGYDVIGMPPPSSGGMAVIQMLNVLEGYDLKANGYGSAKNIHLTTEAMRRAFADRARYLADPDFEKDIPLPMLISKDYAASLRKTINPDQRVEVVDQLVHVDQRITGNHAPVDRRCQAQRGGDDLHARIRLRLENRGAGRRIPVEQRDGRLQRGSRSHRRPRPDRHQPEPGAAGQAHAVEHGADDHFEGRATVHGHRHTRRPHHHQHRADDDPQRDRLTG